MSQTVDRSRLPMPEPPFGGKIGPTYKESTSEWPVLPAPPKGAPNVVIILLDDVGFGQVSTFGGGELGKVEILLGDAGLSEAEERELQAKFHAGINY